MEEKYSYRLLPFCHPSDVCYKLNEYYKAGYEVVALIPNDNGREYTVFLKKIDTP